jgi:hypothetical protein
MEQLYAVAEEFRESKVWDVFSEDELIAVKMEDGITCYVSVGEHSLVGFVGERGLASYLRYVMTDCEGQPLLEAELENSVESYIVVFDGNSAELEAEETRCLDSYGRSYEDGTVPRFLRKRRFSVPWVVEGKEERDMLRLFHAVLFAKGYFASFGKTSVGVSLSPWLDTLGLPDADTVEYVPCVEGSEGHFVMAARILPDDAYDIPCPVSSVPAEEEARSVRRLKSIAGKVVWFSTFLFPDPVLSSKSRAPVFPVAMLLYDPQGHRLLDAYLVEDYETGYDRFVRRLLEHIRDNGKMQAIHCFGSRSLPLLGEFGKKCGIALMEGSASQELEDVKAFFVMQGKS